MEWNNKITCVEIFIHATTGTTQDMISAPPRSRSLERWAERGASARV
jgi:hypothetical protein